MLPCVRDPCTERVRRKQPSGPHGAGRGPMSLSLQKNSPRAPHLPGGRNSGLLLHPRVKTQL